MNQLVTLIQKPLLNNDNLGLQFTLQEMTTNEFVISCSFFDVNGDLVVKSSSEDSLNLNSEKLKRSLNLKKNCPWDCGIRARFIPNSIRADENFLLCFSYVASFDGSTDTNHF